SRSAIPGSSEISAGRTFRRGPTTHPHASAKDATAKKANSKPNTAKLNAHDEWKEIGSEVSRDTTATVAARAKTAAAGPLTRTQINLQMKFTQVSSRYLVL